MISAEILAATKDEKEFCFILTRWGKWARQDSDRPHAYRCPLGSRQISQDPPDPYDDGMILPLGDDDALAIDQAIAKVEAGSTVRRLLVKWFWVFNADVLTVLSAAHDLRRAVKATRGRFELITLMKLKRHVLGEIRREIIRTYKTEKGDFYAD